LEDERVNLLDDWLERGFQLACFIVGDRLAAVQILIGAINKLKTQCQGERKKNYWRDKYLKRRITRIAKGDCDTFQWLIYFEADHYEAQSEQSRQCDSRDMVIRYIKSLVQITTAMSSFYVNIGLNRLFYNYSTAELQKLYESMTERYLGPDEYRRGKGVLLNHLQARFGSLLTVTRTEHGEMRFVSAEDQARWVGLVHDCLTLFTPWSTNGSCPIPADFDLSSHDLRSLLSGRGLEEKVDQNAIELTRCHAFIEPGCFTRLSQGLHLGPPDARLDLPRFSMKNDNENKDRAGRHPQVPPLTEQERLTIRQNLAAEVRRRHRTLPRSLRVTVDGVEAATIQLDQKRDSSFAVPEGAKLVEIWTEHEDKALLLATHLITYKDWQGVVPSWATVPLRGAGKLRLAVSPVKEGNASDGANISLSFRPLASWLAARIAPPPLGLRFVSVPLFSLMVAISLGIGWGLSFISFQRQVANQRAATARLQDDLSREKAVRASLEKRLQSAVTPTEPVSYKLFPDEGFTRGEDNPPMVVVSLPSSPGLVNLEIPIEESGRHTYRAALTLFAGQEEILSLNLLSPIPTAAGPVVVVSLPSRVLRNHSVYTIHLRERRTSGALEEINSFSFRVQEKD
jgi:hypothetical protein